MKIYFEDGPLRSANQLPIKPDYIVKASEGVASNINDIDNLFLSNPNGIVYTNSIMAFSNEYAWNKDLQVPEIYIRSGEYMLFTRIDELTGRELREGHNLAKMYIAGEFEGNSIQKDVDCQVLEDKEL